MPKPVHPDDVRPEFRSVVRDLPRHLGSILDELKLVPVVDWDEDESMQIIFVSTDNDNLSCAAIRFQLPEAPDFGITWQNVQPCRAFTEGEQVGNNGWIRLEDYGAFEVIATDYSTVGEAVADIVDNIRERGIYGSDADGCIYDERFDEAWPEIQFCVGSIESNTEVIFTRNRLGSLVLELEDGHERSVCLVLPKKGDDWRCYVGQRLVGVGEISDLLERNVRTVERESRYDI